MTTQERISNKIKYCQIEVGKIYDNGKIKVISIEPGFDEHSPLLITYAHPDDKELIGLRHCSDFYFRKTYINATK